jgi:hypothetical protein
MIGFIIIIAINIAAAIITFISSSGKIVDRRRRGLNIIRRGGWILIGCFVATIGLTLFQYYETEKQNRNKELQTILDQNRRDSIANKRNQENTDHVVNTFSGALAKYGLKYDSSQKVIEKLVRDSSKMNVTIIDQNDPIISVCSSETSIKLKEANGDTLVFVISLCYENSPIKINANLIAIGSVDGKFKNYGILEKFFKSKELKGAGALESGEVVVQNGSRANIIFFYLYGQYKNLKNTRTYQIDNVSAFNLRERKVGVPGPTVEENLREFLKSLNL